MVTTDPRVEDHLDANVCALLAAKTHVNLFLDDGADGRVPRG